MMIIVWRIVVAVSMALLGLAVGTWLGGHFLVPEGSGLAGAPVALGYGLLGAIVFIVVGLGAAFKLPHITLRNYALFSAFGAVLIYGALTYQAMLKAAAAREPDSAFTAAGSFTAIMERLDTSDPFLFVKMAVDSRKRTWTQTGPGPEYRICTAKMKAGHLADIRTALDNLVAISVEDLAACHSAQGPAIKRLIWDLDGAKGTLDVSAVCAQNHYTIARALTLTENASSKTTSKVKCT